MSKKPSEDGQRDTMTLRQFIRATVQNFVSTLEVVMASVVIIFLGLAIVYFFLEVATFTTGLVALIGMALVGSAIAAWYNR